MAEADDENASEYKRMLALIDSIENDAQKYPQATIDLTSLFNTAPQEEHKHTYIDLLNLIDSIETGREGQRVRVQKTAPIEPSELISSGPSISKVTNQAPQPQQGKFEVPQPQPQKKLKIKIKYNENDLVLPKLSIADQISELERIIEGLKEHVFDEGHMEVVMQEVYGLSAHIDKSSKDLRKRRITLNETEQSMWNMRNQRLQEAMNLIAAGTGAS
ncbi:hypothetical protein M1373_02835 [Candidatus Marsarchaeota archaeon]|nr:hypothetical protein [Candidatus Marsarchaeota archaeon]MCL5404430.1 hypothetical protein [Candidatus Marsarchaeota archaeon]